MKLTDRLLKKLVMEQINEGDDDPKKVDFKPIAQKLGIEDPQYLSGAIQAIAGGDDISKLNSQQKTAIVALINGLVKAGQSGDTGSLTMLTKAFLKFK